MAPMFNKVPYPEVIQSHLPESNPYIQESGAPDVPLAIFWHRMIGSWEGTNGWFHGGHAATAYGVAVLATDGPNKAGKIYEWIAPGNGWYGESSGPVFQPYGDGLLYYRQVGAGGVNRNSKAIEISGDVNTALDVESRAAICGITAYWADQKHIPWNEFPLLKSANRSYVIWHNEITGMTYKTCPGTVVMNETAALIEQTKQLMRKYQEGVEPPTPPKYAVKHPIPGATVTQIYGGKVFFRMTGGLTLAKDQAPMEWASPSATPTSAPYKKGRKISPQYGTVGDDGEAWIVETSGNRFPLASFEEGS